MERFQQDRFAIGFWVDPPADDQMDVRYAAIADAGFTVVLGGFGASTPETIERQLTLCEKFDLKALVYSVSREFDNLPEHPACWGYMIRDEPSAALFPELRAIVDKIRAERPRRLAYINLFPNYANEEQLGTKTYEEHVRRFIDEVNVDVLSMDHYPIFKPDEDGRDDYCENLAVMREESQRAGVPFWNFFNTMPYGPHTDPTEAQLRWQIYTSLAYGAKGVMYFCYWTPGGGEFPKGGAIIHRDGRPSRHYDQAKRINAAVKNFGPTLMQLTSTRVIRIAPDTDVTAALEGSPIKNIARADVDPPHDYLIGVFRHADGRQAVLLNNYRFAYTAWPTVEFARPVEDVREIDPATGQEIAVIDDSPAMDGIQLSLDSGAGRLFLVPAE
ncbi:MAG: hypothetical protein KJ060_05875 [Candidatus Hydrogenedentes bacterium]|nr:hypothetical protein [Candidatus Hydrogenedentota bacterium]